MEPYMIHEVPESLCTRGNTPTTHPSTSCSELDFVMKQSRVKVLELS